MLDQLIRLLDRAVTAYERDVDVRAKCSTDLASIKAAIWRAEEITGEITVPQQPASTATVSVVGVNDDIAPPPPAAPEQPADAPQPTKRGRKAAAPKAPEQTPAAPADQKPELTQDAVRERIIGLSSAGLRSQILGILKTMGYDRLSLVPNERLGELSEQLDAIDPAKAGEPEVF